MKSQGITTTATWRVTDGALVLIRGLASEEAAQEWIRGQVGTVSSLDLTVRPDAYTAAELATIAREVEHEDEIDRLREADEWESDYASDPSGQS